jgi:LacI family transcriptional regulator
MRGRVDGLVLMSPHIDADSLLHLPASLPVVLLCSPAKSPKASSVIIQNFGGARAMVEHLVAQGHKRIAIIKGAAGNYDAAERLRGYRAALRDAGLELEVELERDGDFTEAGGYAATTDIIGSTPRPTAIFAANDSMAIGALSALREAGIRIPEEISVAGFDDITLAHYMDPPLSSVKVPISKLGAIAVEMLLEGIASKGKHKPRRERVSTELVIRRSTGAPYAERPPPDKTRRKSASKSNSRTQ